MDLFSCNKIRYFCIIDKMGNLNFERFSSDGEPLIPDRESRLLYIQSVLAIQMQKEFENRIGMLRYNIRERNMVDIITIPLFDNVVLISLCPNEDCDQIAKKTIQTFEKILK